MRSLIATSAVMLLALPVASQNCFSKNMSGTTPSNQRSPYRWSTGVFRAMAGQQVLGAKYRTQGAGQMTIELWQTRGSSGQPSGMRGRAVIKTSAGFGTYSAMFARPITLANGGYYTLVHIAQGAANSPWDNNLNKVPANRVQPTFSSTDSRTWSRHATGYAWMVEVICQIPPDLPANITNYGTPCGFEYDGTDSVNGQTHNLAFSATKLPANAPVVFAFGLGRTAPVALPIGKCSLVTSLLTTVGSKADARGTAGFKGSTSVTKGVRFNSQAVGLDFANNTLIASTGMSVDFTYTYNMGKELTSAGTLLTAASDNKVLIGLSVVFKKAIDADLLAYQAGIQQAAVLCGQAAKAFTAGSVIEKEALLKNPTYLKMVGIFGTAVGEGLRTIASLQKLLAGGPANATQVRAGLNDMSNALTAAGFSGQQLIPIYTGTTTMKPVAQSIGGFLLAAQKAAGKLTTWLNK